MSTDLARRHTSNDVPSTEVSEAITQALDGLRAIRTFIKAEFHDKVDFGVIPGCGDKPTLFLPGAQKAMMYFNARPKRHIERIDIGGCHVQFIVTTKIVSRSTGQFLGEGVGCCSTMEEKYRYRKAERVCPSCGVAAIIKGKEEYGGGFLCFKKKGGCGAKFGDQAKAITSQPEGQAEHPNLYDVHNTVLKMAKKRCLGGNTPLLVKSSRGVIRTDIEGLWAMRLRSKLPMYVPGIDGQWRQVMGMTREVHDSVYRINIRDGSYIHASGDHRFPTSRGLLEVGSMQEGDRLLRSRIVLEEKGKALGDYGWIAGLYLAEGSKLNDGQGVRFTLNVDEMEFAERIERSAEKLGARTRISPRSKGDTLDVNVYGSAFAGLMSQFIDGSDCYTKHISRFSFRQGTFFLDCVLGGYIAGDGHNLLHRTPGQNQKWILGFTGKNRELAYDLRCACNILDMRINLRPGKSKAAGIEYPTFTGWVTPKVESYNQADLELVVGIKKENRQAVLYDIEVDGDHLFCLANGIQTHNSDVDAAMTLGCLSELFTQDIEDTYPMVEVRESARQEEPEPHHIDGEIIEEHPPSQKSAPGLFTKEHVKVTEKFNAWITEQCDVANETWHKFWEPKIDKAFADGMAVPEKIQDVINPWEAKGHLLKWALATGRISAEVKAEATRTRQTDAYVAWVASQSADSKAAVKAEMFRYITDQDRIKSDAIYRKNPDLAPAGWLEEQAEAEEKPIEVVPKTGRDLFAYVKEFDQIHNFGITKYLNAWGKLNDFAGARMVDWGEQEVALAYAEIKRHTRPFLESKAESVEPDRGDAYEPTEQDILHETMGNA